MPTLPILDMPLGGASYSAQYVGGLRGPISRRHFSLWKGLAMAFGRAWRALATCLLGLLTWGVQPARGAETKIGEEVKRTGDEIVVCGRFFHTTTPVVLWMDPGGYDAYRVERRFGPLEKAAWSYIIKENP